MRLLSLTLITMLIIQGEACAQSSPTSNKTPVPRAAPIKGELLQKIETPLSAKSSKTSKIKCPPAKHAKIPKVKNIELAAAKKDILAAGWKPFETIDKAAVYGREKDILDLGYIELEHCAGTGVGTCIFKYKDKFGNILDLMTQGDDPGPVSAKINCD